MQHHQCVVAVYDSLDRAKEAVRALDKSDFPSKQVSLVTHSVQQEVPRQEEEEMQYGDEAEHDAAKGAAIGGLVGALLGMPLLAIPGVGPVLIAGPLATGMTGAIVGGFLGSMAGWGVHSDHVRQYEENVQQGARLVVANGDPQQVAVAKRVLDETGAREVNLHAETSEDAVEQ